MLRETIRRMILTSVAALHEQGELELPAEGIPAFEVERTQKVEFGDYFANIAMKLARPPQSRAIAARIADYLNEAISVVPAFDLVAKVAPAGPGFINITLQPTWLLRQARTIIAAGPEHVGELELGAGQTVNLEYVSANPTGLVHIGNGRGGFIGDTLGNLMRVAGYQVTKEYYFNDFGAQIDRLGESMAWYIRRSLGEDPPKPAEGYFDNPDDPADTFYQEVARKVLEEVGPEVLALPSAQLATKLGHAAGQYIMADIRRTMERLHIQFDVWFNQSSLDSTGELQEGIHELRDRDFLYEKDGALWMRTADFGDDKDRVIVKSDGEPTYVASDVAYMLNKFRRGFDRLIYILGPDHYGYIGRLKAVAQMLGHPAESVHVLIYQQVNLKINGVATRMSKRRGTVVTLDDLADEVGPDVTRFFYLMRANETHLDFDLALAKKQGDDNPGLSVQYGHARTAGVWRKALEAGLQPDAEARAADPGALAHDGPEQLEAELALMRELSRLEEVIERGALALEPHHLTKYGMDVAAAFHIFYDRCPILRAESDAVRGARLALTLAARTVLARVLTLLGMSVPDRMEREA